MVPAFLIPDVNTTPDQFMTIAKPLQLVRIQPLFPAATGCIGSIAPTLSKPYLIRANETPQ